MLRSLPRCALLLALPSTVLAQAPHHNDVAWAVVPTVSGTKTLRMDIFVPSHGTAPFPVALFIHGGGWNSGSYQAPRKFLNVLLDRGIAVASTSYRLTQEAVFPAQIEDVKGAVRFLRARGSSYGLDACRIGAWGTSAGGHLSSLLGLTAGVKALEGTSGGNSSVTSSVRAVVSYYAPSELLPINSEFTVAVHYDHDAPGSMIGNLIGFPPGLGVIVANPIQYAREVGELRDASPIHYVDAADSPFFLAHAALDWIVPVSQSVKLDAALRTAGVSSTLMLLPGNLHHGSLGEAVEAAAAEFLRARLFAPCP